MTLLNVWHSTLQTLPVLSFNMGWYIFHKLYDGWVREFIESILTIGWEDNKTTYVVAVEKEKTFVFWR